MTTYGEDHEIPSKIISENGHKNCIGKKSFDDEKLVKNYNAIIDALEKEKANNTLKGDLVKQAFITSSMGVSYKVKLGKNI